MERFIFLNKYVLFQGSFNGFVCCRDVLQREIGNLIEDIDFLQVTSYDIQQFSRGFNQHFSCLFSDCIINFFHVLQWLVSDCTKLCSSSESAVISFARPSIVYFKYVVFDFRSIVIVCLFQSCLDDEVNSRSDSGIDAEPTLSGTCMQFFC